MLLRPSSAGNPEVEVMLLQPTKQPAVSCKPRCGRGATNDTEGLWGCSAARCSPVLLSMQGGSSLESSRSLCHRLLMGDLIQKQDGAVHLCAAMHGEGNLRLEGGEGGRLGSTKLGKETWAEWLFALRDTSRRSLMLQFSHWGAALVPHLGAVPFQDVTAVWGSITGVGGSGGPVALP